MNIRTMTLLSALALPGLFACKKDYDENRASRDPAVSATHEKKGGSETANKDLKEENKDLAKEDKKVDERRAENTGALGSATLRSPSNTNLSGTAELTRTDGAPKLIVHLTNASPGSYTVGLRDDCPTGKDFDAKDVKNLGAMTVPQGGAGHFTGALTKDMVGGDDVKDLDKDAIVIFPSAATANANTGDKKDEKKAGEVSTSAVIACGELQVVGGAALPGT